MHLETSLEPLTSQPGNTRSRSGKDDGDASRHPDTAHTLDLGVPPHLRGSALWDFRALPDSPDPPAVLFRETARTDGAPLPTSARGYPTPPGRRA